MGTLPSTARVPAYVWRPGLRQVVVGVTHSPGWGGKGTGTDMAAGKGRQQQVGIRGLPLRASVFSATQDAEAGGGEQGVEICVMREVKTQGW